MKALGVALALLLCAAVSLGFAQPPPQRLIYIVNESTMVTDKQLSDALPAFQAQIDQDLGPAWNVSAQLVIGSPPPLAWRITLTDTPACLFCGGFHDISQGTVEAEVGASTDREWQISFSHELAEMLVDPYLHGNGDGGRFVLAGKRLWLLEVGDPVEDSRFAYERDGVLLSDFTLPNWYRPRSVGPWDFGGHCKRPGEVLVGGYGWFMLAGKWVEV